MSEESAGKAVHYLLEAFNNKEQEHGISYNIYKYFLPVISKYSNLLEQYLPIVEDYLQSGRAGNHEFLETFNAINRNPHIKNKLYPYLVKIKGRELTDFYFENADLLKGVPMQNNLLLRLQSKHKEQVDAFLANFTNKIRDIAMNEYGQEDYWSSINNALENHTYRKRAEAVYKEMLENKEMYFEHPPYSANNLSVKDPFPELVEILESGKKYTVDDLKKEITYARNYKMALNVAGPNEDKRLAKDIAAEGVDSASHVAKIVELFNKLNERPQTYGSDFNKFYPSDLAPVTKINMPEWMYEPIIMAKRSGVIKYERLGSVKNLFDAAKTWSINPNVWRKEAIHIGRMSLKSRLIAANIIEKMYNKHFANKDSDSSSLARSWTKDKSLRENFWLEMQKAQNMPLREALNTYVTKDSLENKLRVISVLFDGNLINDDVRVNLAKKAHIKDIINLNFEAFSKNLDLLSQRYHIDYTNNKSYQELIIPAMNAHKVFGDNLEVYIEEASKVFNQEFILSWLPQNLDEEKFASYQKFISQNLYTIDDQGKRVIRPYEHLLGISSIWNNLNEKEREFSFDRLLGIYYSSKSKKTINNTYKRVEKSQDISGLGKNLNLWQKYIITDLDSVGIVLGNAQRQDRLKEIFALDKISALRKLYSEWDNIAHPRQTVSEGERNHTGARADGRPSQNVSDFLHEASDKRLLLDVVIGNRHDINISERDAISQISTDAIIGFNPGAYTKIMSELVQREMNDQVSSELFKKYYSLVSEHTTKLESEKLKNLKSKYEQHKDWMVPSSVALNNIFGKDYGQYLKKIDIYNKYVADRGSKQRDSVEPSTTIDFDLSRGDAYCDVLDINGVKRHGTAILEDKDHPGQSYIVLPAKDFMYGNVLTADDPRYILKWRGYNKAGEYVEFNEERSFNIKENEHVYHNNAKYSSSDCTIHDAIYWLPRDLNQKDNETFADFINKNLIYSDVNGNKFIRNPVEMEIIGKNWCGLSEEERSLKYREVLAICRSKKYTGAKDALFAEEAAKWGVGESDYRNYERIHLSGQDVPVPFDPQKRFAQNGLVGRFLPRSDVRVGFFGQYTGCCQHFSGVGSACAKSSIQDPFSQCFVVENDKGEIVAGSWIWKSKITEKKEINGKEDLVSYQTATFDNIEAKLSYSSKSSDILSIYKQASQYITEQNYHLVTVGSGNSDVGLSEFFSIDPISLPQGYSSYSDASRQCLIASNPSARPIPENDGKIFISGASQDDIPYFEAVARECFPEGSQTIELPDENPQALVLRDIDKGIVGYVVYSDDEKYITDMAVLPDYRRDENMSSKKLLDAMMKHMAEEGGEWKADLRDKTSMVYVLMQAKRGVVKVTNFDDKPEHIMSNGDKVFTTKFEFVPIEERPEAAKENESVIAKMEKNIGKREKNSGNILSNTLARARNLISH